MERASTSTCSPFSSAYCSASAGFVWMCHLAAISPPVWIVPAGPRSLTTGVF